LLVQEVMIPGKANILSNLSNGKIYWDLINSKKINTLIYL